MNHTSSPPASGYAVAGEIHPDTVVPPYRAGERHEKIIFKEKSYVLQGAIFEVYRKMGSDF